MFLVKENLVAHKIKLENTERAEVTLMSRNYPKNNRSKKFEINFH